MENVERRKKMKIIDSHVHIGGEQLGFHMSEDMVIEMIRKYGVSYVILSNCDCAELDHSQKQLPQELQISQAEGLRRCLVFADKYPEYIGVAPFIKPRTEGLTEEFSTMVKQNREQIKAIKLHPYHSNCSPTDLRVLPYLELAQEIGVPVVCHTGGCEAARPYHVYEAAKLFPNISFVMVHMGLGTDHREAFELLGKQENLYGDTTWVPVGVTLEAMERYGSQKMLFGTDAPIDGVHTYDTDLDGNPSMYQAYFKALPDKLSQEAYENLMWKNAARLFKIRR